MPEKAIKNTSPNHSLEDVIDRYQRLSRYLQLRGPRETLAIIFHITAGYLDYYLNPWARRTSTLPAARPYDIIREIEGRGFRVRDYRIDVEAFRQWLKRTDFTEDYQEYYGPLFIEKALEHFVGADLLSLREDLLIDVAASNSPWSSIVSSLYPVRAIALDMNASTRAPGLFVSASATHLPFSDRSLDYLSLHCAYETFEGNADSLFIAKADRVLKPGGRMVILPLYLHHIAHVYSSPGSDRRKVPYGKELKFWHDRQEGRNRLCGVRFCRIYSVASFFQRVITGKGNLDLTIYNVTNASELSADCYLRFAALFEKKPSPGPVEADGPVMQEPRDLFDQP
jgi:SAM-dependent methyltransferase